MCVDTILGPSLSDRQTASERRLRKCSRRVRINDHGIGDLPITMQESGCSRAVRVDDRGACARAPRTASLIRGPATCSTYAIRFSAEHTVVPTDLSREDAVRNACAPMRLAADQQFSWPLTGQRHPLRRLPSEPNLALKLRNKFRQNSLPVIRSRLDPRKELS